MSLGFLWFWCFLSWWYIFIAQCVYTRIKVISNNLHFKTFSKCYHQDWLVKFWQALAQGLTQVTIQALPQFVTVCLGSFTRVDLVANPITGTVWLAACLKPTFLTSRFLFPNLSICRLVLTCAFGSKGSVTHWLTERNLTFHILVISSRHRFTTYEQGEERAFSGQLISLSKTRQRYKYFFNASKKTKNPDAMLSFLC